MGAILSTESKKRYLSNAFFIADSDRGRAYFRHVIEGVKPARSSSEMAILKYTGPGFFTKRTEAYTGTGVKEWETGQEEIRHLPLPGGRSRITVVHDKFFLAVDTMDGGKIRLCASGASNKCQQYLRSIGAVSVHHWT